MVEQSIIERAANALRDAPWSDRAMGEPLNAHDDAEHLVWIVVAAMREPTDRMVDAGTSGGEWPYPLETWTNMIDAALAEPSTSSPALP